MKKVDQLNALAVKALRKPGRHHDGKGLYLKINPTGAKSWVFRYELDGREHFMGLGSLDNVPLADARDGRDEARKLLKGKKLDPLTACQEARSKARVERFFTNSFIY